MRVASMPFDPSKISMPKAITRFAEKCLRRVDEFLS